jgi:hypothetical protein
MKESQMSDKFKTIQSVLAKVEVSGLYNSIDQDLSLRSLFVFRYLLDQANDIVNLKKDIEDLPFFPERLTASYQDEWIVFCKKTISKLGLKQISPQECAFLVDAPEENDALHVEKEHSGNMEVLTSLKSRIKAMQLSDEFNKQFEQLCVIEKILNSDIAVLKSEQQRKIERFIK